jgi:dipeptidyl aminopeptidase/acylaminoacyl peptidase
LGISPVELRARSSLGHAGSIRQPVLLAHGDKNPMVPLVQAEAFYKALQATNQVSQWMVYKDEGRAWRDPANTVDFYNRMALFLDGNLMPP